MNATPFHPNAVDGTPRVTPAVGANAATVNDTRRNLSEEYAELFAFRAPYLEEKLVKEKILSSHEEAAAYLQELKKYFILLKISGSTHSFMMWSRMVDEVWHQFVLFTVEYTRFSTHFFGHYLQHAPGNAPKTEDAPTPTTRAEFVTAYEAAFGPLPPIWNDADCVKLSTRILRDSPESLEVRSRGDRVELVWLDGEPRRVVGLDAWGQQALRFALEKDAFFVRELPGIRTADKVPLARALLKWPKFFRLGP